MAGTTVSRQILKLGAGCGNSASPDLSGGRGETLVPTGILLLMLLIYVNNILPPRRIVC